jgi:hypothetical protein
MNLPTIGIVVHFLSTTGHPQAEAMSPQGDLALWLSTLHTQQPQNLGSTPTTVPILQLSSPQPAQPKECTPFTTHSPSSCTIHLSGLPVHSVGQEYLSWGLSLSSSGVLTTTFTRLLSHFLNRKNALQAYNPFYRHTCLFLSIKHNQTMVSFKHNMVGALPNTQLLSCCPKYACKTCLYSAYKFPFFSLACLTLTLPKDDCTSSHAPNNYGM